MEIENFEVEEQFLGFSPVNFVDSGRCCLLRGYNVALFHCLPHHPLYYAYSGGSTSDTARHAHARVTYSRNHAGRRRYPAIY